MVDIRSYINALKATWIRRLIKADNLEWVNVFYNLSTINHILDLEGGSPDILELFKLSGKPNYFWKDVFHAWSEVVKCNPPKSSSDFLKSSLWYNNNIRLNNKTLYYRHWVKNGVNLVNDLMGDDCNFLSLDEFRTKYGIRTNFLEYSVILKCVNNSCNCVLENNNVCMQRPFTPFNFDLLLLDKKGSRRLYDVLTSSKKVLRKFVDKWESKLNIGYNFKQWSTVFLIPFKCTLDTKLRWFQFRLTHRILGTNYFLEKIGKKDSNLCTFCKNSEETILHIFCECPIILTLWINVVKWIKEKLNLNLRMDKEMQLFGILNYSMNALNIILLLCRYYIYKTKMKEGVPLIHLFKKDVKSYFSLEKYIFTKNANIIKFDRKWGSYSSLCDI
jgi:hypothetical protein